MLPGLLSLPSPTSPVVFEVRPFTLRYFGLLIVLGIVVGICLTGRELDRKGTVVALAIESLFFVVPWASSALASTTSPPSTIPNMPLARSPRSWRSGMGA